MADRSPKMPYRQDKPARPAPTPNAPAAGRARWPEARHFAALDLGTNNCRLLIARPQGAGFAVVDAFSRIVRLGEGLAATGRLSDAAIERTLSALKVCSDKLKRRNVALSRSVATEACRRASNGPEFIARAYAETGIHLDIISAEEEARLAVLGCHALIEPGEDPALVFDIGGGSTELVLIDTRPAVPVVLDWHSAPWGVVSLTESAGGGEGAELHPGIVAGAAASTASRHSGTRPARVRRSARSSGVSASSCSAAQRSSASQTGTPGASGSVEPSSDTAAASAPKRRASRGGAAAAAPAPTSASRAVRHGRSVMRSTASWAIAR